VIMGSFRSGIRMTAQACATRRVDRAHSPALSTRESSSNGSTPLSAALADQFPYQWFVPHVIHFFDSMTGIHSVVGPFANPLEAVSFADRMQREVEGSGGVFADDVFGGPLGAAS